MAKILILEDEEDLARLFRIALERRGHEVVGILADPRAWLAETTAGRPRPDLVILDEHLGGLSGISFVAPLRAAFPDVQVLLASADAGADRLGAGADAVIRKPFLLKTLVARVESLLSTGAK